jgi:excisionase family DNA binding protein
MTASATLQRRLIRTKEAATYLSMSDWKLRRLIQEGTFPVVQDHEGGPFLLDVRDLDGYVDSHKHALPDVFSTHAQFPITTVSGPSRNRARRTG